MVKNSAIIFSFLLALLLNFLALQCFAQKHPGIVIKYNEKTILCNLTSKQVKNCNPEVDYFWYKSQSIHRTQGGYFNQLLDGRWISRYASGDLFEQGKLDKGVRNGRWITWHDNGKIMFVRNYKKGKIYGPFTINDSNGDCIMEGFVGKNCLYSTTDAANRNLQTITSEPYVKAAFNYIKHLEQCLTKPRKYKFFNLFTR